MWLVCFQTSDIPLYFWITCLTHTVDNVAFHVRWQTAGKQRKWHQFRSNIPKVVFKLCRGCSSTSLLTVECVWYFKQLQVTDWCITRDWTSYPWIDIDVTCKRAELSEMPVFSAGEMKVVPEQINFKAVYHFSHPSRHMIGSCLSELINGLINLRFSQD